MINITEPLWHIGSTDFKKFKQILIIKQVLKISFANVTTDNHNIYLNFNLKLKLRFYICHVLDVALAPLTCSSSFLFYK